MKTNTEIVIKGEGISFVADVPNKDIPKLLDDFKNNRVIHIKKANDGYDLIVRSEDVLAIWVLEKDKAKLLEIKNSSDKD